METALRLTPWRLFDWPCPLRVAQAPMLTQPWRKFAPACARPSLTTPLTRGHVSQTQPLPETSETYSKRRTRPEACWDRHCTFSSYFCCFHITIGFACRIIHYSLVIDLRLCL
ncbi:hypothetical protein EGW08_022985 [Elysia chlorotica]|uniref:Uncharacterized protein n=1 Tax=Elysia chlorotica TaxID=188477 RepID=A0A433SJK6_ELYCH|nr:hypothetical protein EGW08_022985 [Elysia chlorotica]